MPYSLTPETRLCDLPGHIHYVDMPHRNCNEQYWAELSDEERVRIREKIRADVRKYLEH